MIPSPEFPVTKVGMLHRRRNKPLRTYGRQPSTTPEAPASKKRKTTHDPSLLSTPSETQDPVKTEETKDQTDQNTAVVAQKLDSSTKQLEEDGASKPKKGSILSFFKPLPPKQKEEETPAESKSEETEEEPAPLEPSPKRQRRTTRLLRLRPTLPADDPSEDKENHAPRSNRNGVTSTANSSSGASKAKAAPSIQTTLNISARAAFEECRLCDTVWNPSHADDVRYHKRRHAAVLRRRQSGRSTEGSR